MKKLLLPVAAAAAAALVFLDSQPVPPAATAKHAYGTLPVHFEPTPGDKTFAARGAGFALEFGAEGARVHLARASESASLTLRLEGANPSGARPENLLPGISNYFLGDDPRAWRTGVPHYERVRYEGVYPGVDLVYYGANGELEYDFLLAPGADPGDIRMRYEGAQSVRVDDDGNLRVAVDGGEVVHHRPVSYQVVDGTRQSVESAFRLLRTAGEAIVSFEIGKYDARLALTIDPVLSYATYLGGTDNNEEIRSMVVDGAGALYVAGQTNAVDFPVTAGVIQPARGGSFDAFIAKLNPAGTAFEYVTYLGGTNSDETHALRIDAGGNAYLAGQTFSADFPTTAGAAQTTFGGASDVFVAKLNATGGALLFSTYLGGSESETASSHLGGFEVDSNGDTYVYGDTESANFPTTAGAPQTTRGNPNAAQFDEDAFLTRINANGTALTFSTYLGGSGFDVTGDRSFAGKLLAIDGSGDAWIAGTTASADFPASAGAFDASLAGPADAFVARYDTDAGTRTYATYLGGSGDEQAMALEVDASGSAYLATRTSSANFPVSAGAPGATYGGNQDAGVAKLNAAGSALAYGTYIGGNQLEGPEVMRLDAAGSLYVAGSTLSANLPATPGAADMTYAGGFDGFIARLNAAGTAFHYLTYVGGPAEGSVFFLEIDAAGSAYAVLDDDGGGGLVTSGGSAHSGGYDDYFVKVDPNGSTFLDATYLGGTEDDFSFAVALDAQENFYLGGVTSSSNFPVTAGAPQTVKAGAAGADDTFIAKFSTTPASPAAQPGTLALNAAAYAVNENGGTAVINVTRSGGADGAVSVTCSAAAAGGDTATAGTDFTASSVTLNWADGDAASKGCDVAIANDAAIENAETFTVSLSGPTGGAALGASSSATVTINDDDVAPVPQPGTVAFDPASYSVNENGGSVTLTLTRTTGADGAISVSVASGGGSASAGADYTALSQTVNWADGDSGNKTVNLTVLDDATDEVNETVTVTLSNATGGATLGTANATVTIVDDDLPPIPPVPPTQTSNVKARYGGAMDGVLLAMLFGLLAVTLYGRRRAQRRGSNVPVAAGAIACAMFATLPPEARADGWYLGGRAGVAESTQTAAEIELALETLGHDVDVEIQDNQPTYQLFGGYRWSSGFALEASLYDLGDYEVDVTASTTSPGTLLADTETVLADSGRGISAALAWSWRIGENFEITPRVGAYYWESLRRVESEAGRVSDQEFGVDLMGGITFACRIDEHWWMGLDWQAWAANGRNDLRSITASLSYRFGK